MLKGNRQRRSKESAARTRVHPRRVKPHDAKQAARRCQMQAMPGAGRLAQSGALGKAERVQPRHPAPAPSRPPQRARRQFAQNSAGATGQMTGQTRVWAVFRASAQHPVPANAVQPSGSGRVIAPTHATRRHGGLSTPFWTASAAWHPAFFAGYPVFPLRLQGVD